MADGMIYPPSARGHDRPVPTYVYVLECAGYVKIGIATNVATRAANLQLACPLPVSVRHSRLFRTKPVAMAVESDMHAKFAAERMHGEWFRLEVATAIAAVDGHPEETFISPPPVPPAPTDHSYWSEADHRMAKALEF